MRYIELGKTGMMISEVGFCGITITGDPQAELRLLHEAPGGKLLMAYHK